MPKPVFIGVTARPPSRYGQKPAQGDQRTMLSVALFAFAFFVLGTRLVWLGLGSGVYSEADRHNALSTALHRPAIADRDGRILASDIVTGSLFANPRKVVDIDDTVEQLVSVLPELKTSELRAKLESDNQFQWIARKLTPRQQASVHELGLPGLDFTPEPHRVYPTGAEAAHILGYVDVDNAGLAGMETWIDRAPHIARFNPDDDAELAPVRLSMDLSVQHALREELVDALDRYKAKAAAGVVLDIHSGEIVALSSLPDYDPNHRDQALDEEAYNRMTSGVYEMGSVFKVFTVASGLDYGVTSLDQGYDATEPIRVGGHSISDFHAKKRWLSVPEIFIYSSNIGSAKMALDVGTDRQKAFLRKLGLLDPIDTEIGRTASPILPARWQRVNTMTISFGHGLSVTPLQMAAASAALVNGGYRVQPTFLRRSREEARVRAERVISKETSDLMRYLMRLNVKRGSGKQADAEGYRVGGKTGTAEKVVNGRYSRKKLLTSFVSAFPMDAPEYLILVLLDEPHGTKETHGYATAGFNTAAVTGRLVARIGPILGVAPKLEKKPAFDEAIAASY